MRSLVRWLTAFLVCVLTASGAGVPAAAQDGVARVTIECPHIRRPEPRLVVPGEWLPHGCALGVPYRGGTALRFDRREGYTSVRIDGGPAQPAWISVHRPEGLEVLKRELARGSRGFAVLSSPDNLASLPPLPTGRDIALTVTGQLEDFTLLAKQRGVAALSLYAKGLTDLGPLAEFPEVTSLRLINWEGVSDLRPLARLPKLTWLRMTRFPKLADLTPLADVPNLQGLKLHGSNVSDLGPLAGARNLRVLKVYGCEGIQDLVPLAKVEKLTVLHLPGTGISCLTPLAGLTHLVELDLSACKKITDLGPLANLKRLEHIDLDGCDGVNDLAPLREMIRRGGEVTVSKNLRPQLDLLRKQTIPAAHATRLPGR